MSRSLPIDLSSAASVRQLSLFRRLAERFRQSDEHRRQREEQRRLSATDAVVICFDDTSQHRMDSLLARLGVPGNEQRLICCRDDQFDACVRDTPAGEPLFDKKLILVTRHPADVVFANDDGQPSLGGTGPAPRIIGESPPPAAVQNHHGRCDTLIMPLIQRMNRWAREFGRFRHLLLIRDSDLRTQPHATLVRILQFLGCQASGTAIRDTIAAETFDAPARNGVASVAELDRINAIVAAWLAPVYGYDSLGDGQDGAERYVGAIENSGRGLA